MKKNMCSPLLTLALVAVCLSLASTARSEQESGKHFLWRVANVPQPFYVLGSVHQLRKSDYPLPKVMEDVAKQVQTMLFEYDPGQENTFARLLYDGAHYPRGHTMQSKVHPETFAYLMKMFKKSHMNFNRYSELKPWAIAISMFEVPGFKGVRFAEGVDDHFYEKACAEHKKMGGLESPAAHVAVFSGMSDEESEVVLLRAIIYGDNESEEFKQSVAAWKTGDTKRLWDIDTRFRIESPSIHKRLIENRNIAWIPLIEEAIKSGKPTLVIAGANHFCGPQGVPALLQAKGYKLEQL
jgi:uncharacterized protein